MISASIMEITIEEKYSTICKHNIPIKIHYIWQISKYVLIINNINSNLDYSE